MIGTETGLSGIVEFGNHDAAYRCINICIIENNIWGIYSCSMQIFS